MTTGAIQYLLEMGFLTPDTASRMPTHPVRALTPTAPKGTPVVGECKTVPPGIARLIRQMRPSPKAPTIGVAQVRESGIASATRSVPGSSVEPPQPEPAPQSVQAAAIGRYDDGLGARRGALLRVLLFLCFVFREGGVSEAGAEGGEQGHSPSSPRSRCL